MPEPLREELAARGFAVVRAPPDLAPETAARVPWIFAEKLLLEAADMEWAIPLFVPDSADLADERVSPLAAADLTVGAASG